MNTDNRGESHSSRKLSRSQFRHYEYLFQLQFLSLEVRSSQGFLRLCEVQARLFSWSDKRWGFVESAEESFLLSCDLGIRPEANQSLFFF